MDMHIGESGVKSKPRIFVIAEHAVLRDGLRALLNQELGMEWVGGANADTNFFHLIDQLHPNVVLIDTSLPHFLGIEDIRAIRHRHRDIKIVALAVRNTEQDARATLDAGADGYILKQDTRRELFAAIRNVERGKIYLSPSLGREAGAEPRGRAAGSRGAPPPLDIVSDCILEGSQAWERGPSGGKRNGPTGH